jgi:hypothetical protein
MGGRPHACLGITPTVLSPPAGLSLPLPSSIQEEIDAQLLL